MEIIVAGAILLLTIIPGGNAKKSQDLSAPVTPSKTPTQARITSEKPKEPTIHKVTSGETLDSIAKNIYGSSKYWTILWNDNDFISDPRIINAGMTLTIRDEKPEKVEELNDKLAKIYEEITAPSPTPTPEPTKAVATNSLPAGAPSNFDDAYHQAGSRFGVPWEILYGIHRMETGGRDGAITSGYGTGAQGPLQFMPGTWAAYGIDGNGDGNIDINNAIDAIFGAANFLAKHGGVDGGLKAYGGDSNLVYSYARSRGWVQ